MDIILIEYLNWVKFFRLNLVFRYNNYDKYMVGFFFIFIVVYSNKINIEYIGYIL